MIHQCEEPGCYSLQTIKTIYHKKEDNTYIIVWRCSEHLNRKQDFKAKEQLTDESGLY